MSMNRLPKDPPKGRKPEAPKPKAAYPPRNYPNQSRPPARPPGRGWEESNNYNQDMHSHSSYYPPNSYAQQNYEKYELKRPDKDPLNQSLGVPDFFPCTRYAPEEVLTGQTIEHGFKEAKYVSDADEYGSARTEYCEIAKKAADKIWNTMTNLTWKKENTRKGNASATNKDAAKPAGAPLMKRKLFFPEQVASTDSTKKTFFDKLAKPDERLSVLALKVPQGPKGESLIMVLAEQRIPLVRATWYIKISYLNNYYSISQGTPKSTQKDTASTNWTTILVNNIIKQVREFYVKSGLKKTGPDSMGANNAALTSEKRKQKMSYVIRLLHWTYKEGLIDKDALFNALLEELQKSNKVDNQCLILSVLMQYLDDILIKQSVASRLLDFCHTRLFQLYQSNYVSGTFVPDPNNYAIEVKFHSNLVTILRSALIFEPDLLIPAGTDILSVIERALERSNTEGDSKAIIKSSNGSSLFQLSDTDEICIQNLAQLRQRLNTVEQFINPPTTSRSNLIETLENLARTKDIEYIYKHLFSELPLPEKREENVHLLCEWGTTCQSKNEMYRVYITVSLIRRLKADLCAQEGSNISLQDHLSSFLDAGTFNGHSETQVVLLFGELIRANAFSHDNYVRSLISRGLIDRSDNHLHRNFLLQFPIFGECKHERNQRRTSLSSLGIKNDQEIVHSGKQMLKDYLTSLISENQLQANGSSLDALVTFLKTQPFYYQCYFGERIIEHFKDQFEKHKWRYWKGCDYYILQVFYILEISNDLGSISHIIMRLLQSYFNNGNANVLYFVQKYEFLFFWTDGTNELLQQLHNKYDENLGAGLEEKVTNYLCSFIKRYGTLVGVKQWISKAKLNDKLKRKLAEVSKQNTSDTQIQIQPDSSTTDHVAKLSLLNEDNEDTATMNKVFDEVLTEFKTSLAGSDNSYKVVVAAFTQYTKDWPALSSKSLAQKQLSIYQRLVLELRAQGLFGDSDTNAYTCLRDQSISFVKTEQWSETYRAMVSFWFGLVLINFVGLEQFYTNIALPVLQEIEQSPRATQLTPVQVNIVKLLLLDEPAFSQLGVFAAHELSSLRLSASSLSLELAFGLLLYVYKSEVIFNEEYASTHPAHNSALSLLTSAEKDTVIDAVKKEMENFALDNTFVAQICLEDTTNLYEKLKTLRDPTGCRIVFHILSPNETSFLKLHVMEKIDLSEVVKMMQRVLSNTNTWSLNRAWLEIRLLMDELWWLLKSNKRQVINWDGDSFNSEPVLVKLIFNQLTNGLAYDVSFGSILQRLVAILGIEVHKEIVNYTQKLFESMDLLTGTSTLTETIRLFSYEVDKSIDPQYSQATDNYNLFTEILQVVLSSLTEVPNELRVSFIKSVQVQLKQIGERLSTPEEDTIKLKRQRLQIVLRLRFVGAMIVKGVQIPYNYQEELATTLTNLLLVPALQVNTVDGIELWYLILFTLFCLLSEKDGGSAANMTTSNRRALRGLRMDNLNSPLKKKLQELLKTAKLPPTLQQRMEQIMPFLLTAQTEATPATAPTTVPTSAPGTTAAPSTGPVTAKPTTSTSSTLPSNVDAWTILEDYEENHLLKQFNCKRIEKRALTYAESLFRPTTEATATPQKQPPQSQSNQAQQMQQVPQQQQQLSQQQQQYHLQQQQPHQVQVQPQQQQMNNGNRPVINQMHQQQPVPVAVAKHMPTVAYAPSVPNQTTRVVQPVTGVPANVTNASRSYMAVQPAIQVPTQAPINVPQQNIPLRTSLGVQATPIAVPVPQPQAVPPQNLAVNSRKRSVDQMDPSANIEIHKPPAKKQNFGLRVAK